MTCILLIIWFVLNLGIHSSMCTPDSEYDPDPGLTMSEYREWYWTRNHDYTWLANVLILVALFPSLLISLALSGVKAIFSFLFIRKK